MNKQLSYAPVDLEFSYCGEATPAMKEASDIIKRQIFLLCYDEGKTVAELSESLQTNEVYIEDAVTNLCKMGMLEKEEVSGKGSVYLTQFPMFHANIVGKLYKLRNDFLLQNDIPKKLNETLKSCENEIKALDFYGNDLPLEYLNWFLYVVTNNQLEKKIRSYYAEKTDEYLIDSKFFGTQKRDFSLRAFYLYPGEKAEKYDSEKCWNYNSTFYNRVGSFHVNNVMDAKPFPYAWESGIFSWDAGRNKYLHDGNLSTYLKIMKADKADETLQNLTDEEKEILADFIKHGVVKKIDGAQGCESEGRYKGMIPYFTQDTFKQIEKIIAKKMTPFAKELAENLGSKIEEVVLPYMKNVKNRINQFYIFWITEFMTPLMNLWWYGMNVEGLEIPEDYSKSSAAIYIVED